MADRLVTNPQKIMERNVLGHGDNKRDLGRDGFFHGFGGLVPGHVDCGCVWFCFLLGLFRGQTATLSIDVGLHTVLTDGNTGRPRCSPSTPGLTPPTILVPHASDSWTLAVACAVSYGTVLLLKVP